MDLQCQFLHLESVTSFSHIKIGLMEVCNTLVEMGIEYVYLYEVLNCSVQPEIKLFLEIWM